MRGNDGRVTVTAMKNVLSSTEGGEELALNLSTRSRCVAVGRILVEVAKFGVNTDKAG